MPKYINVAKQLVRLYRLNIDCGDVIKEFLVAAEPEEVVKIKHGKWKHGYCSECGYYWGKDAPIANVPNYCPNCGAKMDGKETEDAIH